MKSRLKIIIPLVLVLGGAAYKFVLVKPPVVHSKVHGQIYVLPKEFLVNLESGRFAKVSVGLIVAHDQALAPEAGHGAAAKPPEGFGTMEQEALIRDIVTDTLTERSASELIEAHGREKLKERIAKRIRKSTDVKIEHVLFTDIAVQ